MATTKVQRTAPEKAAINQEALDRATQERSLANYGAIYHGFTEKGIALADITPRVNVFTYNAWLAKGRQVMKGEKGVKVVTWVPIKDKVTGEVTGRRPKDTTVFHISQTKEI